MRIPLVLACLLLTTAASPAAERAAPDFVFTGADTIRTNLWVAQALMADVAREIVAAVPGTDHRVAVRPLADHAASPLMGTALWGALTAAGHTPYLDETETGDDEAAIVPPEVDYAIRYRFEDIDLGYPRVGRKFGLWSHWVDREMGMSVLATVVEPATGRLLLDRRLQRSFDDRVPAGDLQRVDDAIYAFTTAQPAEGGIRSILEEVVVVGALTGLVAIYFANTSN